MRVARFLLVCCLLLTVSAAAFAKEPETSTATDAAHRFYQTYVKLNPQGLPEGEVMKELSPLFTPELVKLFAAAKKAQEKFIRENPRDKPPWTDGNLFTSDFEGGAPTFSFGAPAVFRDKTSIPVYFEAQSGESLIRWIDVIVLERGEKGWKIWNIFLNGPWDFRNGPGLRAVLSQER